MRQTVLTFATTACAACLASALLITCISIRASLAAAEPTAEKVVYTVKDLGTLGGVTSIARDINDCGQVTGQSQNASAQNRGFLWEDSQGMTPIGTLGGPTSPARGINQPDDCDDTGQVVGFSRISSSSTNTQLRAYLAQDGLMTNLGTLTDLSNSGTITTFSNSEAWSIDDSGVAVGRAFNSASEGRAVLWENGKITNLGASLGTPYSEAWAINNFGQVVGEAGNVDQQAKAFLYDNATGGVTDLDALLNRDVFPYPYSEAARINDRGQVVGWSYRTTTNIPPSTPPGPEGKAFLYEKDADGTATMLPLDPLEENLYLERDLYSRARDIDESGRVVGWSRGTRGNAAGQFSATLWEDGEARDLNDLIPASSRWNPADNKGWRLTDAYAINASGQIVGAAFKDSAVIDGNLNQLRAFLLTPDTTSPKIECGAADDLWHKEDVSISCTASDNGVGLADPADASFTLTTSVPAGTETTDAQSDSREVCDAAGNCATAGPIGGNKVDRKAPDISITTSPGGDEYELGDDVTVSYDCADGGSGTVSCSGPVASDGKLDTATVGQHTFSVEAVDEAGNVAYESVTYSVVYDFDGFFSPVDDLPVLNRAKSGSAIPVKFSLGGDQGLNIFATEEDGSSFPKSGAIACDSTEPIDPIEQTVTANSSGLTYDASTDRYTYVWKTNRDWTGCRQLVVKLDDGKDYRANFKFIR